jgi:uncharacterized protein YutE (UPF0331/DUF86 family)
MYFVDRQKIEQSLVYLERQLILFDTNTNWNDHLTSLSLERLIQTSIDTVLDVGNAMIDGFIMRDPGSFEDIIDILMDERVINENHGRQLKELLPVRKSLVQDYTNVSHQEILTAFTRNLESFKNYPEAIRLYLNNELGPVSAFKN